MKYSLEVCNVALALTTIISPRVAAQSPVVPASSSSDRTWDGRMNLAEPEATVGAAQALQKGISVELPVASNAVPMPDADQEDSLIVSVTENGSVYFGVDQISPAALAEKVKDSLSNPLHKDLYIKADARTPYANVLKVLNAVRASGVDAQNLLTAQRGTSGPGTLLPPTGLEVLVGTSLPSGSEATIIQVVNSGQQRPTLKINDQQIPWATLQNMVRHILHNRNEKLVVVKAEGTLPFANVVDVTDVCLSTGAKVVLFTPGL
jgi:biopolymer transport protein ExbD